MKLTPAIGSRLDDPAAELARRNADKRIEELQGHVQTLSAASGRLLGRKILTGAGTYTETAGTTMVRVRAVGGGGGGGGAGGGANAAVGGGGASGVYLDFLIQADAIRGGAFSCGAAGAGGANTGGTGGTGGDTTFTINGKTYTAKGGIGGGGLASVAAGYAIGGIGQAGSSAVDLATQDGGEPGLVISTTLFYGGSGGETPLGIGGGPSSSSQDGYPGQGYGAGGGGACTSAANRAGGAGTAGAIFVEEYS